VARQDLDQVIVVLCEPQDPINIGNSARAMKNMGLTRLRLVQPANPDPRRISISAPRAEDLIESIEVFDSIDAALADVTLTAALSGRVHRAQRRFARPRELAPELLAQARLGGPVALLFGREDRGLSMEQLDRAQIIVQIPTREDYGSLNLGQAVLLMCYELFCACGELPPLAETGRRRYPPATAAQLEGMYGQIEETLWSIEFFKSGVSAGIMRSLRGVMARAGLDEREARMLRGVFAEVLHFARRAQRGGG
jgi:tRNA (cytidine32/uridine32-2'-O)-methyltransferase